jgi:hypothetical protein
VPLAKELQLPRIADLITAPGDTMPSDDNSVIGFTYVLLS